MNTLLDKEATAKLYKNADKAGKKLLEKLHKKEDLIIPPAPFTEWPKIARYYKMDPVKCLPFQKPVNDWQRHSNLNFVMEVMVDYLNTDLATGKKWEPKPGDWGRRVWYDYKPGVGFVFNAAFGACDVSSLGSRLHAKNDEVGALIGKALEAYQNQLFNLQPYKIK